MGLLFLEPHPFHVSVCDLYYNPRTHRIELVQRVFLNDLEDALRVYAKDPKLDVMRPKDTVGFDSLLEAYYSERIALSMSNRAYSIRYLGHKRKKTHMYSYMETDKRLKKPPKQLFILNTLLFEHLHDQQNLINIRVGAQKKSIMLHAQTPEGSVSLDED